MTKKELKNFLGIINKNKCNMKSTILGIDNTKNMLILLKFNGRNKL